MGKAMLRIDLSELTTVRVACRACKKGVVEVPLDGLQRALDGGSCHLCGHELLPHGEDTLYKFKEAALALLALKDRLGIEFEIPAAE